MPRPPALISVLLLFSSFAIGVATLLSAATAGTANPATAANDSVTHPAAAELSVKMTSPIDAVLAWKDAPDAPGGYIVEYINHPTDEWVILGFIPAGVGKNTFTHPRLAPGTPYRYRVRPVYGQTSESIEVTVAEGLSDQAYSDAYAQPEDYSWAPPQKAARPGETMVARKSLRTAATAKAAAPTALKAELMKNTASGFRLTWRDHSTDEEGFLLEQLGTGGDFTVCAVVEPDVNTFGWALEPPARKASFRVRAYYYGRASNVVAITTGGSDEADTKPTGKEKKPTS